MNKLPVAIALAVAACAQIPAASQSPGYRVDPSWPKPLPERWVTGEVAGTCVDANDHVFTVNRGPQNANLTAKEDLVAQASPPVIEFDSEGNVVNSWGDLTILPNGLHGCYVDFQGNFWIAGRRHRAEVLARRQAAAAANRPEG